VSRQAGTLPEAVDLVVYAGDDFRVDVVVTAGGQPADLTGYTADAQVRDSLEQTATVLAEFETTIAADTVTLYLHHDDTAVLPATCYWDVQLTATASEEVTTLARGKVKVSAEVTRP
jgi:hypothetical protein